MKIDLSPVEEPNLAKIAALFGLLGDKKRLAILFSLASGEQNVSTLCGGLKLRQPAVSHHLGLLRRGDVVHARRAGKEVFYKLKGALTAGETGLIITMDNFAMSICPSNKI